MFLGLVMCVLLAASAHAAPRVASYAKQSSGGAPLIRNGVVDTSNVALLASFDDVTLELTPWAQNVDGKPRTDALMELRRRNPKIRLWLYVLVGDFWIAPGYTPQASDRSGFRDVYDSIERTGGWLYGTDGAQWYENYRVDLGNAATVKALGDVYARALSTHLFDGVFLDDCHTSIAWTNGVRTLDCRRAGYRSLASMDSARAVNVGSLVRRLRATVPCMLVAANGTGTMPGLNVRFREGLGSLITDAEAVEWVQEPGWCWLKAECYSPAECADKAARLRAIAEYGNVIISLGPDRGWPPVKP